jgi:hypothetical protein
MTGTRRVSREDADVLRNGIKRFIDDFERLGYDRATIGVALTSFGLGVIQVHIGHDEAMSMIGALKLALTKDQAGLQ